MLTGPQFCGPRTSLRKPEINFHKHLSENPELGLDSWFSSFKLRFSGGPGGEGKGAVLPASLCLHFLLHTYKNRASTSKLSGGESPKETRPVRRASLSPVCRQATRADLAKGVAFRSQGPHRKVEMTGKTIGDKNQVKPEEAASPSRHPQTLPTGQTPDARSLMSS